MATKLKHRAYAALWFMAAVLLPVLFVFGTFLQAPAPRADILEVVIWFLLIPLLITGLLGSLLGARILDSTKKRSGWGAAFRGLLITGAAFLFSAIIISAWDAHKNEYTRFINTLFMMLLVGSMVIGWVVVLIGATAGWLLYQIQMYREAKPGSS
ncbi:MAG: hypothetical protein M3R68_09405 [Acidobacteriota bacterium]|nr:hypothetical protein [Acidobacteriota bacterium]